MPRILLVEDDELGRDLLSRRIGRRGHDVLLALDGREAIRTAQTEQPDLVLMDLGLPGMDGWSAATRLKATQETRDIPIIALTAHAMSGDRERALAAGCDEYLSKPVDFDQLIRRIKSLIENRASS